METKIATVVAILGALLSAGNDAAVGLRLSFDLNDLFSSPSKRLQSEAQQVSEDIVESDFALPFTKTLPLLPDSSSPLLLRQTP